MHPGARGIALFRRFGLPLLLVAAGALHVQLARPFLSPLFARDESGYLANAAALAGYTFDGASSYRAGYSLLLVPFYLLFDNTFVIYRLTQALNIGLALLAIVLMNELLKKLFPAEPREKVLLGLIVAASYPAWSVFSTFALCENVFVPLFVLTCLLCLRTARAGGWSWIAWGAAVGFLIMVTPRASVVAVAGVLVGSVVAVQRRDGKGFGAFIGSIAVLVAFDHWILEPFVLQGLTLGEYPPDLRYPTLAWLLAPLKTLAGLRSLGVHVIAHAAYLLIGTLWLVWFAALYIAKRANESRLQREFRPDVLVLIYVGLAVIGTLALSALHFTSYPNALQLDQWMYGRYVEAVLMPLLAVGFVTMRRNAFVPGFILAWILTWFFVNHARIGVINYINVSALWQPFQLPGWTVLGWCTAGGMLALCAMSLPYGLRAVAYAAVFAMTSVQLHEMNLEYSYRWIGTRHRLASDIRNFYPPGPQGCIGYDEPSVDHPALDSALQAYSNFLFDYRIRRMSFETWASTCDGPLISWKRDLDREHPDVPLHLAAFEIRSHEPSKGGPFLWTREPKPWFRMPLGQALAMSGPEQPAHHILGGGWYEPEGVGTWSTESADLWLPLGDACATGAGCELVLRFSILPIGADRSLTIEAQTDDGRKATWKVTPESATADSHVLDLGNFRVPSSGLRVHLSIPDATSPKEIGHSEDPRTLGIMLRELLVRPKGVAVASEPAT